MKSEIKLFQFHRQLFMLNCIKSLIDLYLLPNCFDSPPSGRLQIAALDMVREALSHFAWPRL